MTGAHAGVGRARTVFLGSGRFAVPLLETLAENPFVSLAAVVTAPPRPAGRRRPLRRSAVHEAAEQRGLNVMTPERLRAPESVAAIRDLVPDLVVLADYGQIVPSPILDLPPHGALNVHPSLLPRHRGAAPIPATILGGDRETGVTLIRMDAGLDTGPIVAQRRIPLTGREVAPELEQRLAEVGADLLAGNLSEWLAGRIEPRPQPPEGATLTRPLRREHGRLDPSLGAARLERQIRALQPWPGSFVELPTGRLIVWHAEPLALEGLPALPPGGVLPGTLLPDNGGLALAVGDGALRLGRVQPAGGRIMTAAELRRGRPALVGSHVARGTMPEGDPERSGYSGAG